MNLVRLLVIVLATVFAAGCELIGDIFQAGFVVGIIVVLLLLGAVGWVFSRFRGRG